MKFLFILSLLLLSTVCFSAPSFSGKYTVGCNGIKIKEVTRNAGVMIAGFGQGQTITLHQLNDFHLSSTPYAGSSLINRISNPGIGDVHLSRKVFKHTSLKITSAEHKIIQEQVPRSFKYRTAGSFCNPYDFTGISCVWGIFVPRNWPKKQTYPRIEKTTIFEKLYNGDVLFLETLTIDYKSATKECRFIKQ